MILLYYIQQKETNFTAQKTEKFKITSEFQKLKKMKLLCLNLL